MPTKIIFIFVLLFAASLVSPISSPAQIDFTGKDDKPQDEAARDTDRELAGEVRVPMALEGPLDPNTYVLGPSDELLLILKGPATTVHRLRVLPEGNVILPNVGAFPAAGLTLSVFREQVREKLRPFYRMLDVDCQLGTPRTFVVFVLGEVNRPGTVEVVAPFRLSRALESAGGVKPKGSSRKVEIRENDAVVSTIDFFSFLNRGVSENNPMLSEGQTVFVPPAEKRVAIIGEVWKPGEYELLEGETAADLLRFAGGITTRGDRERILLEHTNIGSEMTTEFLTERSAGEVALQDMDVMVVRDLISYDADRPVEVQGGGGRTGMMYVKKTEKLSDFLFRLWRFLPEFDIEQAVLERSEPGELPTYIIFDVREVLAGDPVGETIVVPGDVINIPPVDQSVFVAGEVQQPGGIPYLAGNTADRYVALAGGPTNRGDFNKIVIYGRDGSERKGDRNSLVYRGETIVVKQKFSRTLGAIFVGVTSLTSLVISVIALTK